MHLRGPVGGGGRNQCAHVRMQQVVFLQRLGCVLSLLASWEWLARTPQMGTVSIGPIGRPAWHRMARALTADDAQMRTSVVRCVVWLRAAIKDITRTVGVLRSSASVGPTGPPPRGKLPTSPPPFPTPDVGWCPHSDVD